MIGGSQPPRSGPDRIPICREPAIDESGDVLGVRRLREQLLQVSARANNPCADISGMNVKRRMKLHRVEEIAEPSNPFAEQGDLMHVLVGPAHLPLPRAVPEDKAVQRAEAIGL